MAEEAPAEEPTNTQENEKEPDAAPEVEAGKSASEPNEQAKSGTDTTTPAEPGSRQASGAAVDSKGEISEQKSMEATQKQDSKSKSKHLMEAKQSESEYKRRPSETKSKIETRPSFEARPSRDAVSPRESRKSIGSLDIRGSKDSRDLFARKKSSRSIGKAVGSIISFRRGSIAEYFDRQKTAKFMNTYRLDSEKPFNVDKVEKILKEVLIEALDNLTYDADKVPKQAKWASNVIRSKVKEQEFDRYKLICNVTIGEKRSQDVYATYRFLWDADRDKHASYIHENMYVFAIAVCFGIYYE